MEIVSGVHIVPGTRWSRVYLVEDDTLALVDSGLPWNVRPVLNYIRSIGRAPEDLGYILITHSHPDHTSAARAISQRTGAAIVAHADDTKAHSNDDVSLSYMGAFTSTRIPAPFLRRTLVSHTVGDGEVLPLLGGIKALHTPGHTPGSACYLLESRGVLFSGDTIFSNGERVSRSVPFPGYNGQDYRSSIERLATLDFDTLCGGHGEPLVGGASARLRDLLRTRPDPPTWGGLLASIPRRLYRVRSLRGEE